MLKIDKNFLLRVIIIGIIIFLINEFLFQICFVDGLSMYPTLKDKQIVLIKKNNLNLKNNDIIVIKKNGKIIIKRLIGKPNDIIKIDEFVYVNGIKFDDLVIKEKGKIEDEIYLGENEYFVLGDNREQSIDSRFDEIGIIYKNEIIGKVVEINKKDERKNNK